MADGASEPQPSMEEILEMVRRNITEEGRARVARIFGGRGRQDPLDLTEAIDDNGNVVHLAPATSRSEETAPAPTADPTDAAAGDPALRIAVGARTLEDLVEDMLRPLLQAWLDANLPGLVERLVKAELAGRGLPGR